MIGKLIKYEMKSSLRIMLILWGALLAMAVIVGFFLETLNSVFVSSESSALQIMSGLLQVVLPILYGGIFMAVIVVTVLVIIMRFYRGLLGDEGYLMHTLPVKPWQLITSKGVVAAGIVTVSCIAAALSIVILVAFGDIKAVINGFKDMGTALAEEPEYILVVVEGIIILVLSAIKSVYQVYAAMAIGQLSNKHRALISLAAYIGISAVLSILAVILITVTEATGLNAYLVELVVSANIFTTPFAIIQGAMMVVFIITAVQIVAFHIVAERILTKKLNLL